MSAEKGSRFSLGENDKFVQRYPAAEDGKLLLQTFQGSDYSESWEALFLCQKLFPDYSKKVALTQGYDYPDYDEKVSPYIQKLYANYFLTRMNANQYTKQIKKLNPMKYRIQLLYEMMLV